jgi:hypothetical protein
MNDITCGAMHANKKTANNYTKRMARRAMRNKSIACGGSTTILLLLAELVSGKGDGYDPRPRHMQDNIQYLQNNYELTDRNYMVFL